MKKLLTSVLLLVSLSLAAQDLKRYSLQDTTIVNLNLKPSNTSGFSMNVMMGSYYKFNNGGQEFLTVGFELDVYKNKTKVSLQYYGFSEFHIWGNYVNRKQIGFQLGKQQTDKRFVRFRWQLGAAYFGGKSRINDRVERFSTIGVTSKCGIEFIPFCFLSIALDVETNINMKESIYMPILKIGIGKIRPRKRNLPRPLIAMNGL